MLNFINQMGMFGWPLVILASVIVFMVAKYSIKIFGNHHDTTVDINRILILAVLALSLGIFSHFLGLYQGLQIFSQLSSAQFAAGYAVSLFAFLFGLVVFIVSLICWFGLRLRLRSIAKSGQ